MDYSHTQRGPISWMLALVGVAALVAALANINDVRFVLPCGIIGAVMLLLALCFGTLTVADEGRSLLVRFGPVSLLRKHVKYEAISDAQPSRSSMIDGWGIHYVPGRGWTYNLWGKSCVQLTVNGRTIRIGSDDAENLAAFIQEKLAAPGREFAA